MAKSLDVSVTFPGFMVNDIISRTEKLGTNVQEYIRDLVYQDLRALEELILPEKLHVEKIYSKGDEAPYVYGPSRYGFVCGFHNTRHDHDTIMIYAGPRDESGNRDKFCDEAIEELGW